MASRRSPSDPDMERVNPNQDLVRFEGVAPSYSPYEDILVRYSFETGWSYTPTRQDWVGLFHSGWGTTEDYLTYVWAPRSTRPEKCLVIFPANQLQALSMENRAFQFLFVTRGNYVTGMSREFLLSPGEADSRGGSSSNLTVSENSSFTLVGSDVSLDTQGYEDVADMVEKSPTLTESFEIPCKSSSSFQEMACKSSSSFQEMACTSSSSFLVAQLFDISEDGYAKAAATCHANQLEDKETTTNSMRSSERNSTKSKSKKEQKKEAKKLKTVNRDALSEECPSVPKSFEMACESSSSFQEMTCNPSSSLHLAELFDLSDTDTKLQVKATPACEDNPPEQPEAAPTPKKSSKQNSSKSKSKKQKKQKEKAKKIRKVNHDSVTLAGKFTEQKSIEDDLCIVPRHPIVKDFIQNKELSVVPYVPVFHLHMPNDQDKNKEVLKRKPKQELPMAPFKFISQPSSWIHLELMPTCCALCTAARSLLEVYRRQLGIGKTNIRELQSDVVSLRKQLELKECQIADYKEMQTKFKETDETIEEVIIQMSCLKNDISNLLLQNSQLENERNQLKLNLGICQNDLSEVQTKYTKAEVQLNDVLFSLSLKGYSGLIDSTGKNIDLSVIDGEPTDIDGWQLYKNKRCGRLLAIINQQEKSMKTLQASLVEKEDNENKLQSELDDKQRLLQMAKSEVGSLMDEVIQLKGSLDSSMKREESHVRELVNAELELNQYKYEAESREHHLLRQIEELKETLAKKSENTVIASTHRLVAKVSDVCKTTWCAGLCPTMGKSPRPPAALPAATTTASNEDKPKFSRDSISWENEEPVAKQPKVSLTKKPCKRTHKESEAKEIPTARGTHQRRRFPTTCPVCGISFASALDNRVIDEHLAFHDVYRV